MRLHPPDVVRCSCGASLFETPLHFLSCRLLGASRIVRHDRLVNIIARIARLCGVVTQIEPRIDEDDKSRADGHLFFHSQTLMFDASVVDPSAKSYVRCAQRPLGTASRCESRKTDQYSTRCREQVCLFSPVVMEVFGALGNKCKLLVTKI